MTVPCQWPYRETGEDPCERRAEPGVLYCQIHLKLLPTLNKKKPKKPPVAVAEPMDTKKRMHFQCGLCQRSFPNLILLSNHRDAHHAEAKRIEAA